MATWQSNVGDNPVMDNYYPIQGGVEILLFTSQYRNRDKLRPDELFDLYADFTCQPPNGFSSFQFCAFTFHSNCNIIRLVYVGDILLMYLFLLYRHEC